MREELKPCPFCGADMQDFHGHSFAHPLTEGREGACILAGLSFSYRHSRWGTDETIRWNRRATPAALLRNLEYSLADPVLVHANMLRGTIAKPTLEQIMHLYGVDALCKALVPVIVREVEAAATREACAGDDK